MAQEPNNFEPIAVVMTLAAVFLVVLIVRWQKQKKSEENLDVQQLIDEIQDKDLKNEVKAMLDLF